MFFVKFFVLVFLIKVIHACSPTGSTVVGPAGNPGTPGTPAFVAPFPGTGRKRETGRLSHTSNHVLYVAYNTKNIEEAQQSLETIKKLILPKIKTTDSELASFLVNALGHDAEFTFSDEQLTSVIELPQMTTAKCLNFRQTFTDSMLHIIPHVEIFTVICN